MKKNKTRFLCLTLALAVLILQLFSVPFTLSAEELDSGVTFSAANALHLKNVINAPVTFEGKIRVSASASSERRGVIIGNYYPNADAVGVEIYTNGNLDIWSNGGGHCVFDQYDIRTGKIVDFAIVLDRNNKKASLYINGEFKQTKTLSVLPVSSQTNVLCIGGDLRDGNISYLKESELLSVTLFSDMRTAEEIKADSVAQPTSDSALLGAYDLTADAVTRLQDLSPANHDLAGIGSFNVAKTKSFTDKDLYKTPVINQSIQTFEAWVNFPSTLANDVRGGTMLANYIDTTTDDCVNFEVLAGGQIRSYMRKDNVAKSIVFAETDIRTGKLTHVAITFDYAANKACCYINGNLASTVQTTIPKIICSNPYVLGGDLRTGNTCYCRGGVASAAAYSDVRTAFEIKNDMFDYGADNLLFLYDMSNDGTLRLRDLSGNGNHLTYTNSQDPSKNETYEEEGFGFDEDGYVTQEAFPVLPKTFEARVFFDKYAHDRGGVILGNYNTENDCAISFEIYTNGNPRLYYSNGNGTTYNIVFEEVSLYDGQWNDLAVVVDEQAGLFRCYVNGREVATKPFPANFSPELPSNVMALGGDLRSGNAQHFKGRMYSAAFYSDVRTPEEINADRVEADLADENLIAAYDETGVAKKQITDKTGKYNLKRVSSWIDPEDKKPVEGYAYSMAIIGDIQVVTESYPDKLPMIYDWLLENKDDKKISYVMGMGDNTNRDTDKEWSLVKQQWYRLNNSIPYMINRGNHDSAGKINQYFADGVYTQTYDGFYQENKIENTYRFFEISGQKYLLFTLDYGASDSVLQWAGNIITAHPECQVILTTHAYLYRDGTTLDQKDVCPPATTGGYNNGDALWEKFVSKYENIVMMICGHDPCNDVIVTQTKGVNGNTVTQMLVDPQGMDVSGATGMICMLYFSEDGKQVDVEYYSAVRDQYFREQNQFTMTVGDRSINGDLSGTAGDCTWTLDENGVLTISGNGALGDYAIGSSAPWYSYRESITEVIAADGVTGIGSYAFDGCTGLTSVTIPYSVTGIGNNAFANCGNFTVYCYDESYAKDYATANNIPFELIAGCEDIKLSSASLTLTNSIAVNFKADKALLGCCDNFSLSVTLNGIETVITEYKVDGDNIVFTYDNITPDRMNDTITAVLSADYFGKAYTGEALNYSVGQYCYNMLGKTEDGSLKTLLVDLLNYGSAAQIYKNYNVNSLVNASLTDEQKAYASADYTAESILDTEYETVKTPLAVFKGAGLVLKDSVKLRFIIEAEDLSGLKVNISNNEFDVDILPESFEAIAGYDNCYYVNFAGFNATQMSDEIFVTAYKNSEAISNTVLYSIESYVADMQGYSDESLVNLLNEMMKYGNSAKNYVG